MWLKVGRETQERRVSLHFLFQPSTRWLGEQVGAGVGIPRNVWSWQWGPRASAIELLILPSQLPPFRAWTASSPSPFPPTLAEERPNKAWGPSQVCLERGKAKAINLHQSPSWPGTSSRDLVMGKHFQRQRLLYCFFQLREIPQHSLREERQETVGWEWGVYIKWRVRKTKQ